MHPSSEGESKIYKDESTLKGGKRILGNAENISLKAVVGSQKDKFKGSNKSSVGVHSFIQFIPPTLYC